MKFEVIHEFDIPVDALELAVLSPNLFNALAPRLSSETRIESVEQREHVLLNGKLVKCWSYRANIRIPAFAAKYVTPDMCAWEEYSSYDLETHTAAWRIKPSVKPEWAELFESTGTYVLEARAGGRALRRVEGTLELRVPLVRAVAERLILGEVRKTFDAEAETLRELATLV